MKKSSANESFIRHLQVIMVLLVSFFAYPPITKAEIGTPNPLNKLILASAIKPKNQIIGLSSATAVPAHSLPDILSEMTQLSAGE